MCGEQWALRALFDFSAGSSPRVRGTDITAATNANGYGIIPACAGNSLSRSSAPTTSWDHPRVCGEQTDSYSRSTATPGSSPRVRGTGKLSRAILTPLRIIPACAGNRLKSRTTAVSSGDHPRVCGEQALGPAELGVLHGIIPACAGNSEGSDIDVEFTRDHPRVCGEQAFTGTTTDRPEGSSPRVRGTAPVGARVEYIVGIIPACAGNSCA